MDFNFDHLAITVSDLENLLDFTEIFLVLEF